MVFISILKGDTMKINDLTFKDGLKDSLPVAIGYIPIAIAFGLTSKSYNIPDYIIILMSLIVFAGSSQFVGAKLISLNVPVPEIVLTTFIINFRNFLMSGAISQRIDQNMSFRLKSFLSFFITDESFAIISYRNSILNWKYLLGLQGFLYFTFNLGTVMGIFLIENLNSNIKNCLGITIYAMFISLLIPSIKKSFKTLSVCLIAVFVSLTLTYLPINISKAWIILISTITASFYAACMFQKGEANE